MLILFLLSVKYFTLSDDFSHSCRQILSGDQQLVDAVVEVCQLETGGYFRKYSSAVFDGGL